MQWLMMFSRQEVVEKAKPTIKINVEVINMLVISNGAISVWCEMDPWFGQRQHLVNAVDVEMILVICRCISRRVIHVGN